MDALINEIITIIQKEHLETTDYHRLIELSSCNNNEVRYFCAEGLAFYNDKEALLTLMKLAKDNDEMVRVNACDSLGFFANPEVLSALFEIARNDENILVVQYAILAIGDILNKDSHKIDKATAICELKEILQQVDEIQIKLSIYYSLYRAGLKEYLSKFLDGMRQPDYHIREFVVNLLVDILNEDNYRDIYDKVRITKRCEKSKTVIEAINSIISIINKKFP